MGAYTRGKRLADVRVRESMSHDIAVCRADEDIARAADAMRKAKVRRLPVVDEAGKLVGILSMNDIARAASHDASIGRELVQTMASVCAPHPKRAILPHAKAAEAALASSHRS
jgi:CBS domain-containing protein